MWLEDDVYTLDEIRRVRDMDLKHMNVLLIPGSKEAKLFTVLYEEIMDPPMTVGQTLTEILKREHERETGA